MNLRVSHYLQINLVLYKGNQDSKLKTDIDLIANW